MKRQILIATLFVMMTAGVGVALAESPNQDQVGTARQEQICGAAIYSDSFTVEVVSTGCTQISDFVWVLERTGPSEIGAQLIRIQPDLCDAMEHRFTLEFDRAALGIHGTNPINLKNSFRGSCPEGW